MLYILNEIQWTRLIHALHALVPPLTDESSHSQRVNNDWFTPEFYRKFWYNPIKLFYIKVQDLWKGNMYKKNCNLFQYVLYDNKSCNILETESYENFGMADREILF